MRLTEISYGSAQTVEGYGPGFFRVGGHVLRGACLITPWDAGLWGGLSDTETPLAMVGKIDVLLLGMGAEIGHPPRAFRAVRHDAAAGGKPQQEFRRRGGRAQCEACPRR